MASSEERDRVRQMVLRAFEEYGWCKVCGKELKPCKDLMPSVGVAIWRSCKCAAIDNSDEV